MKMSQKQIRAVEIHIQLFQARHQGLFAFRPVKSRVDHQTPAVAADEIRIQQFHRVLRQRNLDSVNIFHQFSNHRYVFLFCIKNAVRPLQKAER